MDIVSALRQAVADRVGRERFHLWFGDSAQFLWDGVRVFVVVPNQFYLDWLRTRFHKHVNDGCAAVLGYSPPIDFRLKPPDKTNRHPSLFAQSDVLRSPVGLQEGICPADSSKPGEPSEPPMPGMAPDGKTEESRDGSGTRTNGERWLPSAAEAGEKASNAVPAKPGLLAPEGFLFPMHADDACVQGGSKVASRNGNGKREGFSDGCPSPAPCDSAAPVVTPSLSGSVGNGAAASRDAELPGSSTQSRGNRPGRRFASLSEFVVGPSNQLAFAAAETVVRNLGEYSPLTIFGPTGTGKTHLLEGVWSAVRRRHRHIPALYLSAEQFTSAFIDAIKGGGVAALRMRYRGVRLLILDDLQFFRGKRQTQIELLYTIDALLKNGSQVICAADHSPQQLGELGGELISRLQSGMVCRLDPPDAATRLQIVARAAGAVNLNLPESVCHWLSQRLPGDVRQLMGAVCRLKAFAEASGAQIGRKEAEELLADLAAATPSEVPIEEIEQALCHTLGLPDNSLRADTKDRRISQPRMLAMWLARKYTHAPLNEIGQYFGKKSHATVISAKKRVDLWLVQNAELRGDHRTWKVADVVEEVHRRLRAG